MAVTTLTDGDSYPWRLKDVLRVKAGLNEKEIEEFLGTEDFEDFVESVMALEEQYGIEICEEDFLERGNRQEG